MALVEGDALVVEEANVCGASDADWILDSGATELMSFDKAAFNNYQELKSSRIVRFANRQTATITGIGDVQLESFVNGHLKNITLKDVLHIPQLHRKLISISAVTERGLL